jgi:hypothetical protein
MKLNSRRRQLEQSPRSWKPAQRGPFGPVTVYASTAEALLARETGRP